MTEEMSWEEMFDALIEAHIRLPDAEPELKANGKKFIRELMYRVGVNATLKAFEAYSVGTYVPIGTDSGRISSSVNPFNIDGDGIDWTKA